MMYGLYLSATGVMTNSYRQDVIANNLANSETAGFKRDLTMFRQRLTAAQERGLATTPGNPLQEMIGGGTFAEPTMVDTSQGGLDPTGNALDLAIDGHGYFSVLSQKGGSRLTRNGAMMVDRQGHLVLSGDQVQQVLDTDGQPITLDPTQRITVTKDGQITQNGKAVARLGLFDVPDASALHKEGDTLLSYPQGTNLSAASGAVRSGYLEMANVDPSVELSELMDTQRQLEANANMIRYQDQTLGELVNSVGKIS